MNEQTTTKITKFRDIPSYTRSASYRVNVPWVDLPHQIERYKKEKLAPLDMDPLFQRGHVWTRNQQIAFVEYALRGGMSGKDIYFNCVGWMKNWKGPFVLVDGKQRLTAVLAFLNNELPVFGSYFNEFTDNLSYSHVDFVFHVNDLQTEKDVLTWYIQMNSGGTPHSPEEIRKVEEMLKKSN